MASPLAIFGYNPTNGNDRLLAVYGNDIVRVDTGAGYGQNIFSTNIPSFAAFLDKTWFVNRSDKPRNFDGTTWTTTGAALHFPNGSFIRAYKSKIRLFVGDIILLGVRYPSRAWYSDLPANNTLTWGYETGTNLQQAAGSNVLTAPGALFQTYNIKVGDPLTIGDGPNQGEYLVSSVVSETQLTLTEPLTTSYPASSYWVGGNFIDIATDDNDTLIGFGENSDRLLFFKKDSLHRYDLTTLRQIKGGPGTTSGRSVVNIREKTMYFNRNGFWETDGVGSDLISRKIQPYIDGISSSNYDKVIGWKVGDDIYRAFVGDITNADEDISITNAFIDFDTAMQTWSIGSYPYGVTAATEYIESQAKNIYIGTNTNAVYQDNIGNADGTTPIELRGETVWHFPFGPLAAGIMTRVHVWNRTGRAVSVKYKLLGIPSQAGETFSKDWIGLGEIKDYMTELKFSKSDPVFGRAIKFLFTESSTNKPPAIEKVIVFGIPETTRSLDKE